MRDHYETILLNLRIPEPANIEFYGNIYLVKTSVTFTIRRHHGWTEGRTMKENFITYEDGNFTGPIGEEFYVHSGGFKRVWMLCIEGECLR